MDVAFLSEKPKPFYNEERRERFISEVIGDPEGDVLASYVKILEGCVARRCPSVANAS